MITNIYIETSPGTYDLLDPFEDENINIQYKLKDSTDLNKAYSPFSLQFTVPASDKNNLLLNHHFESRLVRTSTALGINAKIYVGGNLFKVGRIHISGDGKFKNNVLIAYALVFTTALKSLKDLVGDAKLNQMTGGTIFDWTEANVYTAMANNDMSVNPVMVPLISMNRVLDYDSGLINDIKFNGGFTSYPSAGTSKCINYQELRPAIPFSYVMNSIVQNYGLDINIPFSGESMYKDLCVHLIGGSIPANTTLVHRTPSQLDSLMLPGGWHTYTWTLTAGVTDDLFILNNLSNDNTVDGIFGFAINPKTIFTLNTDEKLTAKVTIKDYSTNPLGVVIDTGAASVDDAGYMRYSVPFTSIKFGNTAITNAVGAPLQLKVHLEFSTPAIWGQESDSPATITTNRYVYITMRDKVDRSKYFQWSFNNIKSDGTGSNQFNVLKTLPSIKVIDFLNSFVKIFNLSIRQNKDNQTLNFERPSDFYNTTVDYTPYTDIEAFTKTSVSLYNSYDFKHKTSKFYGNENFAIANSGNVNGVEYGELALKLESDFFKDEYKVEPIYTIVPQTPLGYMNYLTHYGFTTDTPVTSTLYGALYKENLDELVLFYNTGVAEFRTVSSSASVGFKLGVSIVELDEWNEIRLLDSGINRTDIFLSDAIEFYNTSLTFKNEPNLKFVGTSMDKNLYYNFYEDKIDRLNNPNTRFSTYDCYLPTTEITNFDPRNNVIIGETLYSIEEANINITTGKTKLKLLNYTTDETHTISPPIFYLKRSMGPVRRYYYYGTLSKYTIAYYEIQDVGNGFPTRKYTANTYFAIDIPIGFVTTQLKVTAVDIFGNVSPVVTTNF